jgi:GxxExxY protein
MAPRELVGEELTGSIIGVFYDVYNTLGYGFLEHVYIMALERELLGRGHGVGREVAVEISYKGHPLATQRIDMIVDGLVVVETKATMLLHKTAPRQLFNYLRATNLEVGLLLHFGPEPAFYRIVSLNSQRIAGEPSPGSES